MKNINYINPNKLGFLKVEDTEDSLFIFSEELNLCQYNFIYLLNNLFKADWRSSSVVADIISLFAARKWQKSKKSWN